LASEFGEPNPEKLLAKISRKNLIWWRVRHELKLSKLHDKWEYYFAKLSNELKSLFDGEPREIQEGLIKLEIKTPEDIEKAQRIKDEQFLAAFAATARRQQENKRK